MKRQFTRTGTIATCLGLACLFLTGTGLAGTTATTVINLNCQTGAPGRMITIPTNTVTRQMGVLRGVGGPSENFDFFLDVTLQDGALWDASGPPVTGSLSFGATAAPATYTVQLIGAPIGTATATYAVFITDGTPAAFPTGTFTTTGLAVTDVNNLLAGGGIVPITVSTRDLNSAALIDVGGIDTVNWLRIVGGCPISGEHFLSYQIKHEAEVFLADQFIQGFFRIGEPVALLNPADKDGGGIFDPDTHLVSYKVKGPEFDKVENVLVENQFGQFVVDVKKPDRLLVPASKSLIGPFSPPPPDNSTHDVDHFLCYQIEDDDDDNLGILISVVDQFNQPKLFDVKKPRRFCNPVDKNGEGIKNPQTHLMCFSVRRARGEPKHERIDGIFVNDQFGPGQVRTKKERELCVPSTKTLP